METRVCRWIVISILPLAMTNCTCARKYLSKYSRAPSSVEESVDMTRPPELSPRDLQNRKLTNELPSYEGLTIETVQIVEDEIGQGNPVRMGDEVHLRYLAWYYDPKRLKNHGWQIAGPPPVKMSFKVGSNKVIAGINQGIIGMRPGGRRSIIVPSRYAYGDRGVLFIKGKAHLVVEMWLDEK